jgi:hypothetical protein
MNEGKLGTTGPEGEVSLENRNLHFALQRRALAFGRFSGQIGHLMFEVSLFPSHYLQAIKGSSPLLEARVTRSFHLLQAFPRSQPHGGFTYLLGGNSSDGGPRLVPCLSFSAGISRSRATAGSIPTTGAVAGRVIPGYELVEGTFATADVKVDSFSAHSAGRTGLASMSAESEAETYK